jgi:hypothetical protein
MSESLLESTLACCRARLLIVEDCPRKRKLQGRLALRDDVVAAAVLSS